jgi:hypothetical protein
MPTLAGGFADLRVNAFPAHLSEDGRIGNAAHPLPISAPFRDAMA